MLVEAEFNSIAADFVEHLTEMFPEADDAATHDAYFHVVAAAMHNLSDNLRRDSLTGGRLRTGAVITLMSLSADLHARNGIT